MTAVGVANAVTKASHFVHIDDTQLYYCENALRAGCLQGPDINKKVQAMRNSVVSIATASMLTLSLSAQALDYISVVGSSTVYPFATVVAENFGKNTRFKTKHP